MNKIEKKTIQYDHEKLKQVNMIIMKENKNNQNINFD